MKIKKVLVLYKRSAYKIYFLDQKSTFLKKKRQLFEEKIKHFKHLHDEHYQSLNQVAKVLSNHKIPFLKNLRGQKVSYRGFDFIITVGGDGTFLEASQNVKDQIILGVNSSPGYSVGKYCAMAGPNFEKTLKAILEDKFKIIFLPRLSVKVDNGSQILNALNDILVCHADPAAMSRYVIEIGKHKEEQRSSGVWIATPSGSTGAIKSAGGKVLKSDDRRFQYRPRELYEWKRKKYCLRGGLLKPSQSIAITSLMRGGMACIDGTHIRLPFPYGSQLKVTMSSHPLKTIHL